MTKIVSTVPPNFFNSVFVSSQTFLHFFHLLAGLIMISGIFLNFSTLSLNLRNCIPLLGACVTGWLLLLLPDFIQRFVYV